MRVETLRIASFVPYIELPAAPSGNPVQLRESGGKITAFVAVHSSRCGGCRDYLASLAPLAAEFQVWDARLLVLVPEPLLEARNFRPPFGRVLSDSGLRLADPESASVLVADRYGQIFESVYAGTGHALASPRVLEEWLKYIGTLCPE